jgi:hypothetical protein
MRPFPVRVVPVDVEEGPVDVAEGGAVAAVVVGVTGHHAKDVFLQSQAVEVDSEEADQVDLLRSNCSVLAVGVNCNSVQEGAEVSSVEGEEEDSVAEAADPQRAAQEALEHSVAHSMQL